jgi:hypothetical protein
MKKVYYIIGMLLGLSLIGCEQICSLNNEDITNMYSVYVDQWKQESIESFNKAEKEIFKKDIVPPKPNDGTNPDPAKCICNGTGIIVQGDGHKTECPYHGKSMRKGK